MPDPQVTARRAPAQHREPGATVGEADRMSARDALEACQLLRGRQGHQDPLGHAHQREEEA
ncbi:hypothetical protein [Deinococcus aerius]|uniref:hypothetical protein n=1 Tax=Deinococcus aerius TaxID=200253 RepID=UPI001F2FCF3F|nr:hypothetical protein [Deinococcus aerius]